MASRKDSFHSFILSVKSSDLSAKFLVLYVKFGLKVMVRLDLRLYSNACLYMPSQEKGQHRPTAKVVKRLGGVRPPSPPPSQSEGGSSYKAVIMLFLKGGMDSFQMLLGCAILHEVILQPVAVGFGPFNQRLVLWFCGIAVPEMAPS